MVFAVSPCCRAVWPFLLFYHLRAYGPGRVAGLFSNPDASVPAPPRLAELSWLAGRREFDLGALAHAVGHGGDAGLSWASLCRPARLVAAEAGLSRAVVRRLDERFQGGVASIYSWLRSPHGDRQWPDPRRPRQHAV